MKLKLDKSATQKLVPNNNQNPLKMLKKLFSSKFPFSFLERKTDVSFKSVLDTQLDLNRLETVQIVQSVHIVCSFHSNYYSCFQSLVEFLHILIDVHLNGLNLSTLNRITTQLSFLSQIFSL